jgi:hypothetical protein
VRATRPAAARKRAERSIRVNRIARALADRYAKAGGIAGGSRKPLSRKARKLKLSRLIAYDLETTRIKAGRTPDVLYLTAYAEDWQCSMPVRDDKHLLEILETRFLIEPFNKARFVAWNGNNFDVYLVARALLQSNDYILRPYLTRSKNLRGLRVTRADDPKASWEFLDGISMTGLTGKPLREFLAVFAPDHAKLDGPDFEREDFDAKNPAHVAYAERDSEGLYYGLKRAESITIENFETGLAPTVGNMGIKIFQAHIPANVVIWGPNYQLTKILREQVMRGGYCFCARKFEGPIWKYDINQAYAAAMREARLPSGRCIWNPKGLNKYARTFIVKVKGFNPKNRVPFYYRDMKGVAGHAASAIDETWITSIEYQQLISEGWRLAAMESYFWEDDFSMTEYVDKLEALRINAPGGPNGAQGLMLKSIGNNSYGKTVEQLDGLELVMSLDQPKGFSHYQSESKDTEHIWFKFGRPVLREYHQPHIGAFITAHVRMVVRRAILQDADSWLYADTDCVIFSRPVALALDPKKYGMWKVEAAGEVYRIITKKVYADLGAEVRHAKGINVRRLTPEDFAAWYAGRPPRQTQTHRQNFVRFMRGADMFIERTKVGQRVPPVSTPEKRLAFG